MTIAQTIYNIANITIILISIRFVILGIKLRKKNKIIISNLHKIHEDRIKAFSDFYETTIKNQEEINVRVNNTQERLNLLSNENVKLREENEELKERLRNIGIRDFDI